MLVLGLVGGVRIRWICCWMTEAEMRNGIGEMLGRMLAWVVGDGKWGEDRAPLWQW